MKLVWKANLRLSKPHKDYASHYKDASTAQGNISAIYKISEFGSQTSSNLKPRCLNSVWTGIGFLGDAHRGPAVCFAVGIAGSCTKIHWIQGKSLGHLKLRTYFFCPCFHCLLAFSALIALELSSIIEKCALGNWKRVLMTHQRMNHRAFLVNPLAKENWDGSHAFFKVRFTPTFFCSQSQGQRPMPKIGLEPLLTQSLFLLRSGQVPFIAFTLHKNCDICTCERCVFDGLLFASSASLWNRLFPLVQLSATPESKRFEIQ